MPTSLVVTHERLGTWARQLRTRLGSTSMTPSGGSPNGTGAGGVRLVETRSGADLAAAVRGVATPIVLIDLGDRPLAMLEDLDEAARVAPGGLFLVLDPARRPGVPALARELGATLALTGVVPPPRVADLIVRWIPLARRRAEADGWSAPDDPRPEPWEADGRGR